jgi:hypothetical protein
MPTHSTGKPRLRTVKTLSFRKEQLIRLAHARRRLALALALDLTDSLLLERLIEDALEPWVARQLKANACSRPQEKP